MIRPLFSAIGMNSAGRDLAALGMRPAAERFDADHGLAAVVDDRLVGDAQLVVLDRRAQVVLEQLALEQVGVHRGVVDAGAIAALVLGAVERHVGVAHDVGGATDRARGSAAMPIVAPITMVWLLIE